MHLNFGREVQEVVSMASNAADARKIGKGNIHYIYNNTMGLLMAQSGVSGSLKMCNRSRNSESSRSSNNRRNSEN